MVIIINGSTNIELLILSASSKYTNALNSSNPIIVTSFGRTNNNWHFLLDNTNNLVGINKIGITNTEVHVLSAARNYQSYLENSQERSAFIRQISTSLSITDNTWRFLLDTSNNLVGINMNGTTRTELHILSSERNYQAPFISQISTSLGRTDNNWHFLLNKNNDLLCICARGTNGTDIHRLLAASNYQTFNLQIPTLLK